MLEDQANTQCASENFADKLIAIKAQFQNAAMKNKMHNAAVTLMETQLVFVKIFEKNFI